MDDNEQFIYMLLESSLEDSVEARRAWKNVRTKYRLACAFEAFVNKCSLRSFDEIAELMTEVLDAKQTN